MVLFWLGLLVLAANALRVNLRGLPEVTLVDLRSDWKRRVLPGWADVVGGCMALIGIVLSNRGGEPQAVLFGWLLGLALLIGQVMLRAQLLAMVALWRGARGLMVEGGNVDDSDQERHTRGTRDRPSRS